MAVAADEQAGHGVLIDLPVGQHRGGVQQTQDLLEALRIAVVRGSRRQQERLGGGRESAGQFVVLGAHVGGVVDLIDHHRVPAHLLQLRAVLRALQRVHGHDHAGKVRERVAAGRQHLAHALDACGVQAHQRDGEAGPQFLLELLHDVLRRDHEDALTASAADQLGEDHADLECLAQADGIGDEDAGAEIVVGKRLAYGSELVIQRIHEHLIRHRELLLVQRHRGLAQRGLQPQARRAVAGGAVRDDLHPGGVKDLHVVDGGVEARRGVTHVIRQAANLEQVPVHGLGDAGDQPQLVADLDHEARRVGGGVHRVIGARFRRCFLRGRRHTRQVIRRARCGGGLYRTGV